MAYNVISVEKAIRKRYCRMCNKDIMPKALIITARVKQGYRSSQASVCIPCVMKKIKKMYKGNSGIMLKEELYESQSLS